MSRSTLSSLFFPGTDMSNRAGPREEAQGAYDFVEMDLPSSNYTWEELMPLFQEIAFREDIPVIHARRKDGVIVIATRIPMKDVLPERWGWILALGGKGGIMGYDDIETLQDNMGRRYPKVFLRPDMFSYIERWECSEWEPGYSDGEVGLLKEIGLPDMNQFKENLLRELATMYRTEREEQTQYLQTLVEMQVQRLQNHGQQVVTEVQHALQGIISSDGNKLSQQLFSIQDINEQHWDTLEEKIIEESNRSRNEIIAVGKNLSQEQQKLEEIIAHHQTVVLEKLGEQATLFESMGQQSQLSEQALTEHLASLNQKLEEVIAHNETAVLEKLGEQATLFESMGQQSQLSEQALTRCLTTLNQEQAERFDALIAMTKQVQTHVAELQEFFEPENTDDEILGDDEIKKLARNTKTLSERYITGIVNLNSRYHQTVDKQVKESFRLTRIVIYVGLGLFVLTVLATLFLFIFSNEKIALLTNGAGAILSAITTGFGGWNKIHDDAANRQLQTLANLSNTVKTVHAQFMIEQVSDETWQKTQYERLLSQLTSIAVQK